MTRNESDEGQTKLEAVDVPIGEIELPQIDVTPYVGRKVKITEVGTFKGGRFGGYMVRMQTEIVATVEGGRKPIDIRGSKVFGLQEDAEGRIGWGAGTKLDKFLKTMKAKTPAECKGKTVVLQKQEGTSFLTFVE